MVAKRHRKRLQAPWLVLGGLILIGVVGWLALRLLLDSGPVRAQAESRLAETLRMSVEITQPPSFSFWGWPSLTFNDITIRRENHLVATIDRARVTLGLSSLLATPRQVRSLHLEGLVLIVERFSPGVFNLYEQGQVSWDRGPLSLKRWQVSNARLEVRDQVREQHWSLEGCHQDLHAVNHEGGDLGELAATLLVEGVFHCDTLGGKPEILNDLSIQVRAEQGVIGLTSIAARVLSGQLTGHAEVNLAGDTPTITLENRFDAVDTASLIQLLDGDKPLVGEMDLELVLSAGGSDAQALRNSLTGRVSLRADELTLQGIDLDAQLNSFEDSQQFNLLDVGAVFLAGPLGLIASRGYTLSTVFEESDGSTRIAQVVSDWRIENGVMTAEDVAFSTEENRLALNGTLDIGESRIEELRIALVDSDGCAVIEQAVSGPFSDPQVTRAETLAQVAVIGPVLDLFVQGAEAIADVDCELFYSGSVAQP